MKLMYEDNYPDNVSSMDPNFWQEDEVFDENNIRFAKINYTTFNSEYGEGDETLYFDNDGYGTDFMDYVIENTTQIVKDYLEQEGAVDELMIVDDIIFVDESGQEFYSQNL